MKLFKQELPYDPAISLPGMYPGHWVYTIVFIAALFTVARKGNQGSCSLIDEWMTKFRDTCKMDYYSVLTKNEE